MAKIKKTDGNIPLTNIKKETFLNFVAQGETPARAYILAFPESEDLPIKKIQNRATLMIKNNRIRFNVLKKKYNEELQERGVLTKDQLALFYSDIVMPNLSHMVEEDEAGELFIRFKPELLYNPALDKFNVCKITDKRGIAVHGIYLTSLSMTDRLKAAQSLSKLMGYDPKSQLELSADDGLMQLLENINGQGLDLPVIEDAEIVDDIPESPLALPLPE